MRTIDRDTGLARVTNNGRRNRQEKYREAMKAAGFVQVTGWVHEHQQADAIEYLKALRLRDDLTTGSLRNIETHRFVSIRAALDNDEAE